MTRLWPGSSVTLAVMLLGGCGGPKEGPPASVAEAVQQVTAAVAHAGVATTPVDGEVLSSHLPDVVAGMSRTGGQRQNNMGGLSMSMASASYRDGRRRVEITITDAAGVGLMAGLGTAWALSDFDRTTTTGYERTLRIQGFKAMESLQRSGGVLRTEISLLAGERFLVRLKGTGVEVEALKDALETIDPRKLAARN